MIYIVCKTYIFRSYLQLIYYRSHRPMRRECSCWYCNVHADSIFEQGDSAGLRKQQWLGLIQIFIKVYRYYYFWFISIVGTSIMVHKRDTSYIIFFSSHWPIREKIKHSKVHKKYGLQSEDLTKDQSF